MTWFANLSPCRYFGDEFSDCLVAVGWLGRDKSFSTGPVDGRVYSTLIEMLKNPWQPVFVMGFHNCDLCLYDGTPGHKNLFIPNGRSAFVAPELIVHYMNAHGYRPPEEFCNAVLACPPMKSMDYLRAMTAAARPFVKRKPPDEG